MRRMPMSLYIECFTFLRPLPLKLSSIFSLSKPSDTSCASRYAPLNPLWALSLHCMQWALVGVILVLVIAIIIILSLK